MRNFRATLSKIKFALGFKPSIEKTNEPYIQYIPHGYKAVCLISADFEMAWASRYTKSTKLPLEKAVKDGALTRENIPIILDICDKYNIPVTWATVGHLFLEGCTKIEGTKHPDIPRPRYFENRFWKFDTGDWFDYDPCSDYTMDPAWYAPDIIKDILSRKVKHEIGCHTFSHIDCSDDVCSQEEFLAEIATCQELAARYGIKETSFVHPGHTVGHLEDLKALGFLCYRTDFEDKLCYPHKHKTGLWEFSNTAQIEDRPGFSLEYSVHRYKTIIDRAIKSHTVCNLWFHPQIQNSEFVSLIFNAIFEYLDQHREDVLTTTMSEYADFLNGGR